MSKFDRARAAVGATGTLTSPVRAEGETTTHEGAPAFARDAKGDLFLLAVTNMVGEGTFYESADARDERFRALVRQGTTEDPAWVARFVPWLRTGALMRSASVVAAVEYARAGGMYPRRVVDAACQRADEPGEVLAYCELRGYPVAGGLQRGVADAVTRLYDEHAVSKYDGKSRTWRMGDVVEVVHPTPRAPWQSDLFRWLMGRRRDREGLAVPESCGIIRARADLEAMPAEERRALLVDPSAAERLRAAGMTWEALSGWLGGPMDAAAWEAVIPSMGYMALLRNLRNFDEAGVADTVAQAVCARLADPEQVARSRQFPFRFWSAYQAAPSSRWSYALDQALDAAVGNVPEFTGRSLVLVDTSASMTNTPISARSTITPGVAAAVFGVAVAKRGRADLVGFADGAFRHDVPKAASALRTIESFLGRTGEVGHGTNLIGSARATFDGHDRVVIVSDMQTMDARLDDVIPANVPVYGFNLGGYAGTPIKSGRANRHEFGGLTDATFRQIALLESRTSADWPF